MIMENEPGKSKDPASRKSDIDTNDNDYKYSLESDKTPTGKSEVSVEHSLSSPNGSAIQGSHSGLTPDNPASEIPKENEEEKKILQPAFDSKNMPSIETDMIPKENSDEKKNLSTKRFSYNDSLLTDQTSETSRNPTSKDSAAQGSHGISGTPLEEKFESTGTSPGSATVPSSPSEGSLTDILINRKDTFKRGVSADTSPDTYELISEVPDYETRESRTRKVERRPSYLRRQLIAMENQLSLDNIEKKVSHIYPPTQLSSTSSDELPIEKKTPRTYLSSSMAVMFIVSIMTGSSMTSVSFYLKMSGWFGVFFMILLALNAMYAGLCIGWSWLILEEMWPEYREYSRIPYQDIAYRAFGLGMKYVVSVVIDVAVLGTCAVHIIFIADSIENVTYQHVRFCYMLLIVTAFLLPFVMFGSYRNIKAIGILDVSLSILITFFFILGFFLDKPSQPESDFDFFVLDEVVTTFGGFSFAYGYGPAISNILLDMKDRTMFTHSLTTAIIVGTVLYILLAIMGYGAYGNATPFDILKMILTNQTYRPFGVFINALYIIQLMTSFIVLILPSMLAFEVRVHCPDRFSLPRVLVRASILVCILLLVLSVPTLSKYVEVVGATAVNLATFILPPVAYVCLVFQQSTNSRRNISKKEWLLIVETVLLGLILAVVASLTRYDAARSGFPDRMSCFSSMRNTDSYKIKKWVTWRRPDQYNVTNYSI